MNRTYRKSILRTVKSSLPRFLSIFAIVALGVGFLSGLLSTTPDMRLSADGYCDDTNMMDVRLLSTLGLTDDDLAAVKQIEGIKAIAPVYDSDVLLTLPLGQTLVTRMHSLPTDTSAENPAYMNQLQLIEGRMPEKAGECVLLQSSTLTGLPAKVGDRLSLDASNESPEDTFAVKDFEVVGIAKTAYYMSVEREHSTLGNGTVSMMAYTPDSSFSSEIYTGFYLTLEGALENNAFSADYDALVEKVSTTLEVLGNERAPLRYDEVVGDAKTQLMDAKVELADARAEAEEKLADAEKELANARREIADGEKKLADGKQAIIDGQTELDRNKDLFAQQIPTAQKALTEARTAANEGRAKITAVYTKLEQTLAQLTAQETQIAGLETGKAALFQLATSIGLPVNDGSDAEALALLPQVIAAVGPTSPETAAQLTALQAGLNATAAQGQTTETARAALEAGKQQYSAALTQIQAQDSALAQQETLLGQKEKELNATIIAAQNGFIQADKALLDARAEVADAEKKLSDARVQYADGEKEYTEKKAEADQKLSDAEEEILDAEAKLRDIGNCEWYIFDRSDNLSFASYASNADKIEAIARVFPVFFFLVAALVALTTMTRMVEEERIQIGTLKALGYSNSKIMLKYLLYAGLAGVLGSAAGLAVGIRLFPSLIINAYNIMYEIPKAVTPFDWPICITSAAAMTICVLLATVNACWAELKEVPARLMLPKAPKAGKRIFLESMPFVWRRLKFTHKVTARNLIRYKKRFFMTVIGIAGCTALLVTGFGVKDSISDIVSKQFDDLYNYNLMVPLKNTDALNGRDLNALLNDKELVQDHLAVLQEEWTVVPASGKPKDSISLLVPQDAEKYTEFFTFRHRTNNIPMVFDDNAVVVTEKFAARQGLAVGDEVTITNSDNRKAVFTITDICENYVSHYLFISRSAYEKAFSQTADPNLLLCRATEDANLQNTLSEKLLKCRDVAGVQFTSELSTSFANSIRSINSIVVVLIVSAGALAFVVLYNLTNINITEREKELATIKVLGFYDREVAAYIYRETAVLSLFGTGVGLILGVFLHQFVIRTAEIDMVMFGRSIYAPSYLYAAVLTLLFSLVVALVMRPKLSGISMVESLKAPE